MKQKDLKIDFRYLTGNIACLSVDSISGESVHNDINNEEAIIIFNSLVGEKANCQTVKSLLKENQQLNKQLEEVESILGLRQKRNLIHKFDKEYDEEDKKKNPNRDYAGIMPDAEEVYRRYYSMKDQQKEFIEYMNKTIEELECDDVGDEELKHCLIERIDTFKEILQKYKSIIGVSDEKEN